MNWIEPNIHCIADNYYRDNERKSRFEKKVEKVLTSTTPVIALHKLTGITGRQMGKYGHRIKGGYYGGKGCLYIPKVRNFLKRSFCAPGYGSKKCCRVIAQKGE